MQHKHIKYSIGQTEPEFNEFPVNLQYRLPSKQKLIYKHLDFAPEAQCFGFFFLFVLVTIIKMNFDL